MPIVGVISDTHGLLRPEALTLLSAADHIIHAGDIGAPEILEQLRRIAPLTVVRGNNDREPWTESIPATAVVEIGGHRLYAVHNVAEIDLDPAAAGISVVIAGHSHQPSVTQSKGVMFLNPGSAGPRRFKLPITLALLRISAREIRPEIHEIEIAKRPAGSSTKRKTRP
jgi:uncharacterized protein